MKNIFTLMVLFLATCQFTFADLDPKTIKKLEKAQKLTEQNKYDAAEKIYRELVDVHPYYATVWNEYAKFGANRYSYYQRTDKNFNITVSGGTDSMTQALTELFSTIKPSRIYYDKFIDICKEATIKNEYAYYPSVYLRSYLYDKKVDAKVSDTAYYHFRVAEKHFGKANYIEAAKQYQIAIGLDSNFYQARLYLGDSYYMLKDYVTAAQYFRNAIKVEPTLVEPRKFLVDALTNLGAYEEATEECVQSMLIYPDVAMYLKLEDLAQRKGKKFNREWIYREILPAVSYKQQPINVKSASWKYYLDAKAKFDTAFYDKKTGIIKDNPVTKQKYLEVYCWEQMLKQAPIEHFKAAREMHEKGYLDCYVLFSLFHQDTYEQYAHLGKTDRTRLRAYIDLLIK
ncbi:MAG: tetratricopeptide repeat protein [Bacteroidia bacterium]